MNNYQNVPMIYQNSYAGGGAACLRMILAYYGLNVSLEELKLDWSEEKGCNAGSLLRAAKDYGLDTHGYERDADELLQQEMPCIIHWDLNNYRTFFVLEGYETVRIGNRRKLFFRVNDPANGRLRLSMNEFIQGYTKVVLTFCPNTELAFRDQYRFTKMFYQREPKECGAACLAMILSAYGKTIWPEMEYSHEEGVTALDIKQTAEKYGLIAKGFKAEPDSLYSTEMPCILHWGFNHFVVLEGFEYIVTEHDRKVLAFVNDPAIGRRRVSFEELDHHFTGVVMTFREQE